MRAGIAGEPGLWEAAVRATLGSGHTGEREFLFYLFLEKMIFPNSEQDARKMIEYSITFLSRRMSVLCTVCLYVLCISVLSAKFPQACTRGEEIFRLRMGAIGMRKPDE